MGREQTLCSTISAKNAYNELLDIHSVMLKKYDALFLDITSRVVSNNDIDIRIQNINLMLQWAWEFVSTYRATINAYLRNNRRAFSGYILQCLSFQESKDHLQEVVDDVSKIHGVVEGHLVEVSKYIRDEGKDDNTFSPYVPLITKIRTKIERSRLLYERTFANMHLTRPLVFDFQNLIVICIKLMKLCITYIILRVAKSWFERDIHKKIVKSEDLTALVRRAAVLLIAFDVVAALFVFALGQTLKRTSMRELWRALLIDAVMSDCVLMVLAAVISRLMSIKKYFKLRENREANLSTFINVTIYIAIVNFFVPYHFMV